MSRSASAPSALVISEARVSTSIPRIPERRFRPAQMRSGSLLALLDPAPRNCPGTTDAGTVHPLPWSDGAPGSRTSRVEAILVVTDPGPSRCLDVRVSDSRPPSRASARHGPARARQAVPGIERSGANGSAASRQATAKPSAINPASPGCVSAASRRSASTSVSLTVTVQLTVARSTDPATTSQSPERIRQAPTSNSASIPSVGQISQPSASNASLAGPTSGAARRSWRRERHGARSSRRRPRPAPRLRG